MLVKDHMRNLAQNQEKIAVLAGEIGNGHAEETVETEHGEFNQLKWAEAELNEIQEREDKLKEKFDGI